MFTQKESDFAIPVIGFLMIGIFSVFKTMRMFNGEYDFLDASSDSMYVTYTIAAILLIVAAMAFQRAYLVEGATFLMFGILNIYIAPSDAIIYEFEIAMLAGFAVIAFVSYYIGDIFVCILNALLAISCLFFVVDFDGVLILQGILALVCACIAMYLCVDDWLLAEDIIADYEDALFDDEDECCCDDEDCHCHDE